MVNKDIIVQRSKAYGNNFPFLAKIWMNYFKSIYNVDIQINAKDAAMMMCLHKISRLSNNPEDSDTLQDMINYAWLGIDYTEYTDMLQDPLSPPQSMSDQQQCMQCYRGGTSVCVYDQKFSISGLKCKLSDTYQDCVWNMPLEIN